MISFMSEKEKIHIPDEIVDLEDVQYISTSVEFGKTTEIEEVDLEMEVPEEPKKRKKIKIEIREKDATEGELF